MSSEEELGLSDLGEMLCGVATDTMVTATRNGLVRFWQSPDLANLRRAEMQRMVADAQIASDWDERKRIFQRACQAEEEGRISLAVELYDSLGRSNDVNRLLKRQRGD